MKRILIAAILGCLLLVGCTAPTQPLAVEAMRRGIDHTQNIVYDLANEAKQTHLTLADIKVRAAVDAAAVAGAAGDDAGVAAAGDKASEAATYAFNKCNKINWLQIQYERARAYLRIAQVKLWSEKGILNIAAEEFAESKRRSDQKYEKGDDQQATIDPVSHNNVDVIDALAKQK